MNLRDAAYNVVHDYPGGSESLAPRVGKNATTLSHEVNGTGGAKLGLETAEKITQLSGDLRILQAFALNCGQMLLPLPGVEHTQQDDCMLKLAGTAHDFGKLCTEVAGDLADGKITDNELARIDHECGRLIASLHSMRQALAQRNQDSKPAHERAAG
ncbi:MAG: phage regulatory CII family protein [Pseudomonadota bacterium]